MEMVWEFLNSAPGIALMVAMLGWIAKMLFTVTPSWEVYEGAIISAIKHAEKAIPEDASNKGMRKLDQAFQYVLTVYAAKNKGASPSVKEEHNLREGIQIVHEELEHRKAK